MRYMVLLIIQEEIQNLDCCLTGNSYFGKTQLLCCGCEESLMYILISVQNNGSDFAKSTHAVSYCCSAAEQ